MADLPYRLVETTPPATEPLTLSDVKIHLRIDFDHDDDVLNDLIMAAREMVEDFTKISLIHRTYKMYLDHFPTTSNLKWWDGTKEGVTTPQKPNILHLPKPPLSSITAVRTYDANNVASTYASMYYYTDTAGMPGRLVLKDMAPTPTTTKPTNGIEIEFIAGYGDTAAAVPQTMKEAMKRIIAHLYTNRGDDVTTAMRSSGAQDLLHPFRKMSLS